MKKKEKMKQKMLELTQQQIQVDPKHLPTLETFTEIFQDAEKQKQNLLSSPDQVNLNKLIITEEKKVNGHEQNSADESDEDIPVIEAGNGHDKNSDQATASAGATADLPADIDKLSDLAESDATSRRKESRTSIEQIQHESF